MDPIDAGIAGLIRQPAGWTKPSGEDAEIVMTSRVRLARNLNAGSFPGRSKPEERRQVMDTVRNEARGINYFQQASCFELDKLSFIGRTALLERRAASPALVDALGQSAVVVSPEQTLSLMINEEDHLRLQALLPGLDVLEAFRVADQVDDHLQQKIEIAYSSQYGFLTACPSNLGTGLRGSVLLHLPALALSKKLDPLIEELSHQNIMARGLYGEGSQISASLVQISNRATMGISELEIVEEVERAARLMVSEEKKAREELLEKARAETEDKVYRAWGILANARVLMLDEYFSLWSAMRFGVGLGIINKPGLADLNLYLIALQPAHLQLSLDQTLNQEQQDIQRASKARELFPLN
jgi:protein arginine kinase